MAKVKTPAKKKEPKADVCKRCTLAKEKCQCSPRKTIMEYIKLLSENKTEWHQLSEYDKSQFDPYIVNRFISMNPYLITLANEVQRAFNIGDKAQIWKVYYEILPSERIYINYIKAKEMGDINEKAIQNLMIHFRCRWEIAVEYYHLLQRTEHGQQELNEIMTYYAEQKVKKSN